MAAPMEKILSRKISQFAFISRILIIVFQIIFNKLLPDHDAGVFNPPSSRRDELFTDQAASFLFGGLRRWDAVYFTHISEFGYTYENTLAFFPLFPVLVRLVSNLLFVPLQFCMGYKSVVLSTSVIANIYFFVKTAVCFYKLGRLVIGNDIIAYKAALLFCITPASVFMSAPYSETLFAYLTTTSLLKLAAGKKLSSAVYIGLSCTTRSNGLLNIGYLAYEMLKETLKQMRSLKNAVMMKAAVIFTVPWIFFITTILPYSVLLAICIAPFVLYQYYCYRLYCAKDYKLEVPSHILQYGRSNGLKLSVDEPSEWCNSTFPLAYSYIQTHYWDQGFLKYWKFKQMPNFTLALPVTVMVVALAVDFFKNNRYICLTLGLDDYGASKKEPVSHFFQLEGTRLLPYVLHAVILTVFGWSFIHIQVLTRLLFSSTFVLYWYAACLISEGVPRHQKRNKYDITKSPERDIERPENLNHPIRNLVTDQFMDFSSQTFITKCILCYFIGYSVIGVALFSNFLPWT